MIESAIVISWCTSHRAFGVHEVVGVPYWISCGLCFDCGTSGTAYFDIFANRVKISAKIQIKPSANVNICEPF